MATRCKMHCNYVKTWDNGTREINMAPVYGETPENKAFFAATPGGRLDFYTVNKSVEIEQGKDYYVDITLAE